VRRSDRNPRPGAVKVQWFGKVAALDARRRECRPVVGVRQLQPGRREFVLKGPTSGEFAVECAVDGKVTDQADETAGVFSVSSVAGVGEIEAIEAEEV
jgi:hypothetical protein